MKKKNWTEGWMEGRLVL